MSKKGRASSYLLTFIKDLIFIGPFFIVSFTVLKRWNAVPVDDPFWIAFWAGLVGLCMTSVAWLSLQMFKVVLADQLELNRAREDRK